MPEETLPNQTTSTQPEPASAPAAPLTTAQNPMVVNNTPPKKKYGLSKKMVIIILVLLGLVVIAAAGGFYFMNQSKSPEPIVTVSPTPDPNAQVVCTQDAKQCPDGSYVSRSGPKCEFAPCPTGSASSSADTSTWKIYKSNKVEGLSFSGYILKYPSGWTEKTDSQDGYSYLKLTNGEYSINIKQAGYDGSACSTETSDVKVNPSVGLIRKSMQTNNGKVTFPYCMSKIGKTYYESANPPNEKVISEMDEILKTVEVQ